MYTYIYIYLYIGITQYYTVFFEVVFEFIIKVSGPVISILLESEQGLSPPLKKILLGSKCQALQLSYIYLYLPIFTFCSS